MYCYAGNNPVRYTDPDGRAGELAATMWWLCAVDGPLPIGDIVYGALVFVDVLLFAAVLENTANIARTEAETQTYTPMYHYSNISPDKWIGPLNAGAYITPDGTYSGREADSKLALPNNIDGTPRIPKYRYTILVKRGEYTAAENSLENNIVAPYDGKPGGGIEFRTTVPKIPIECIEITE